MKPPITLSINPSYHCNFKCDFCYLTPKQLQDRTRLPLYLLEERLDSVLSHYSVEHVDLYGGEPLLLPEAYLDALVAILHARGIRDIGLNTNLSVVPKHANDPDVYVSVSFDFHAREQSDRVMMNMFRIDQPFSVLVLASPTVLTLHPKDVIQQFNMYANLESVEIKPYSINQANRHPVSYLDFENFVQALIDEPTPKRFQFVNEDLIQESLSGKRNAYSDNHLYITPTGRFAVLEFDLNDHEYFLELHRIEDYQQWCVQEKARVAKNAFCGSCEFKGRCLSEHLRDVKSLDQSCNGFYNLLKAASK